MTVNDAERDNCEYYLLQETLFLLLQSSIDPLRNLSYTFHLCFLLRHSGNTCLESTFVITKSIAQCQAQVGVVEEAAEKKPGEAKFEGVMWHGEYDQSITSSAAQAPHTAPILPGPLPFVRYTSAAKTERKRDDERTERSRMMHAYKFACWL